MPSGRDPSWPWVEAFRARATRSGWLAEILTVEQERVVTTAYRAVARIAADRFGVTEPLLYARIDIVRGADGQDLVLEVELNEPSFFLPVDAGAADRFVAAVLHQVGE